MRSGANLPRMGDIFDVLEVVDTLRKVPETAKAAVTEMAEKLGLDTFPEVWALVQKGEAGKWELVAVSLDRALLPEAPPGAFLLKARLGHP